jgi:DNA mismatch repair protein MutS
LAPEQLPAELNSAITTLGGHNALIDQLAAALRDDALPAQARDGGFIRSGYAPQLDELIKLRDDSDQLIRALQQHYIEKTGVTTLKIRNNNVIGYFIEASPTQADKLLAMKDLFIHRQTMTTGVRFATVKLALMSQAVLQTKPLAREQVIQAVYTVSRFMDHLAEPELSLQIYKETQWDRDARLRALLGDM